MTFVFASNARLDQHSSQDIMRLFHPQTPSICLSVAIAFFSALAPCEESNPAPPSPPSSPSVQALPTLREGQILVKVNSVTPTVKLSSDPNNANSTLSYYSVAFEYKGQVFSTQLPYDPGPYLIVQDTPPLPNPGSNAAPSDTTATQVLTPGASAPMDASNLNMPGNAYIPQGVEPIYIVPPPDWYPPYPYPMALGSYWAAFPIRYGSGFYPNYYHGGGWPRFAPRAGGHAHGRR